MTTSFGNETTNAQRTSNSFLERDRFQYGIIPNPSVQQEVLGGKPPRVQYAAAPNQIAINRHFPSRASPTKPLKIIIIRHAERVDAVLGSDWSRKSFDRSGRYVRFNEHLPEKSVAARKEKINKNAFFARCFSFSVCRIDLICIITSSMFRWPIEDEFTLSKRAKRFSLTITRPTFVIRVRRCVAFRRPMVFSTEWENEWFLFNWFDESIRQNRRAFELFVSSSHRSRNRDCSNVI